MVALLLESYGLTCTSVERLAGELDENFKVEARTGAFFLKVAHSAESAEVTGFQTAVLRHLQLHAPDLPVPRIIPSLTGNLEFAVRVGAEGRRGRLTTFMPGKPFDGLQTTASLRRNVGESLAGLTMALATFSHPAADKLELLWDIGRASGLRDIVGHLPDPAMRDSLLTGIDDFDERILPRLGPLRQQIVHNDFTANNLLRNESGNQITAILDFGDMAKTQLVNDLAVAAAYSLVPANNLLEPALDVIAGYHSVFPLLEEETEVLFDLVVTRTVLRLAITEWRATCFPENRGYILRNNARTWRILDGLRSIPRHQAQEAISNICKAA